MSKGKQIDQKQVVKMARYIDAEAVCEALKSMASVQLPDKQSTILGVVSSIGNFPTADVAPRAEVAREIFEEIENALESCYTPDSCADYPSPYYDLGLADRIAELKKEYTDVEPSKGGCHE